MHSRIQPGTHVALRLPSDSIKVVLLAPNTTISLGKYGTCSANLLFGRPFNLTFEIVEDVVSLDAPTLRVVPASELYADAQTEPELESPASADKVLDGGDGVEYEVVGEDGEVMMRSNRLTIDNPSQQKMTMDEIEALKKEGSGAGKDLVARILESHAGLDQKTAFSLAKYTLRKTRKYLRRFTVLPIDVPLLTHWLMTERDASKIMELRGEMLSLLGSWANVHYAPRLAETELPGTTIGRWLVVDETGGLVVAALAERMGILYLREDDESTEDQTRHAEEMETPGSTAADQDSDIKEEHVQPACHGLPAMSARNNTLTLIHANAQPNLALLKYFSFDSNTPSPRHPLYTHLKTLSWLQLLDPQDDASYAEPEIMPEEELKQLKSTKRGQYYRKRRRWERVKSVVDETRAGGFDGIVIASLMNPATILQHTIPILRGAAQVVIYSPHIEPLTELADLYSTPRRTAFVTKPPAPEEFPSEDFPLDPSLLLAPSIQTAKVRRWQCLPGRTHPLMMARGGAEGYLFTATRVLPAEGKVEARGKFKKRKIVDRGGLTSSESVATSTSS